MWNDFGISSEHASRRQRLTCHFLFVIVELFNKEWPMVLHVSTFSSQVQHRFAALRPFQLAAGMSSPVVLFDLALKSNELSNNVVRPFHQIIRLACLCE